MELYLDLENTLLNDHSKMNEKGIALLKSVLSQHTITILTTSALANIPKEVFLKNIRIVSTLENKLFFNGKEYYEPLEIEELNKFMKSPDLYTAYSIHHGETQVIKYQERLKYFYPTSVLKLVHSFHFSASFVVLAISANKEQDFLEDLKKYAIRILAKDKNRVILLVTAATSTKEYWLKKLKKSPAIGIGDSFEDYDFIKHCEIQVAMQNADDRLLALCPYHTSKSNEENGALSFILDDLKLLQA